MPIAKPVLEYLNENEVDIERVIDHVIQLCETLEYLHKKGISHRDIKPSNIYFYKERFYFGDFGLLNFQITQIILQNRIKDWGQSLLFLQRWSGILKKQMGKSRCFFFSKNIMDVSN